MRFFFFISLIFTLIFLSSCGNNRHIVKELRQQIKDEKAALKIEEQYVKIDAIYDTSIVVDEEIQGLKNDFKSFKDSKKEGIKRAKSSKRRFSMSSGGVSNKKNRRREYKKELRELKRQYREIKKNDIVLDYDADGVPDIKDVEPDTISVELSNIIMVEAPYDSVEYYDAVYDEKEYIPEVENMDIVDNTSDDNSSKGTIAYSVPKEMKVGESYVIKLRITKDKGKEVNKTLVLGDREIPISDVNIDSRVTIENVRVAKTMTAELMSEDGAFKVTPQNTSKQVIEDGEYTEWGWMVTPLKSGKTYLKLIIKIKIDVDGETTYKDIVVFDKDIEVKANLKHGVKSWLSEYWQWLMTTIIIPVVVFFYKKREKKKEEQKNS
jgi:RNAse (barnase) inhibitor barstar